MKTIIHWFRRDLRLTDNTALAAALDRGENIVPVYILSDWEKSHGWTGANRQQFLCDSLAALAGNIQHKGGSLVVRQGDAVEELAKLARETKAEGICFNRDPDPFGRRVEARLAEAGLGIEIGAFKDACLHEREEVLSATGTPYRVFTPYGKTWATLPKDKPKGAPRVLRTLGGVPSLSLPTTGVWKLGEAANILPGGEKAARARMSAFLSGGLGDYGAKRDSLAEEGTSRLSQDLRYGLISIRELFARCQERIAALGASARGRAQKYVGELIWREFYMNILWHHPEVLEQDFNPRFRDLRWEKNAGHFRRWQEGQTGFPIIDAAMRQLAQTGFMHNRARMITAMFLTKDLHLHWREGEGHFMRLLVDGEIASNNGGWQWSAGTGADAAPYFRIQNPWTQTARYDPDGAYVKKWVPELKDVPAALLAKAPVSGSLAPGYPEPMVDHARERARALELFAECAN